MARPPILQAGALLQETAVRQHAAAQAAREAVHPAAAVAHQVALLRVIADSNRNKTIAIILTYILLQ